VHPPREESDLTPLGEERWVWLQSALGFVRIDPAVQPLRDTLGTGREGRELWVVALSGVLLLLVVEMLVARALSAAAPAAAGAGVAFTPGPIVDRNEMTPASEQELVER
jgi:hypothetical protein